jgi:hypothetical protein
VASLLSTGRQIKGSAMAGLSSAARSEAQTNIAEEQLEQAKKAQQAQLLGTGLGVGGAYLMMPGCRSRSSRPQEEPLHLQLLAEQQVQPQQPNPAAAAMGLQTGTAAAGAAGAGAGAGAAGAGAGAAGGATALLANPMTWAVVAGLYVLKNIFD